MRNCYRWTALLCAALAVVLTCGGCARLGSLPEGRSLTLAERGQTGFTIVIAEDASPSTRYGASELQHYLREITGAEFPVQTDAVPMGTQEIILGDSKHLRQLGMQVDFDALGDEGYVLRTAGPHLVIAGGALRGNLYGVYGLLDDYLGCKWFTTQVERIPKKSTLRLAALDETQIPALEYREPFVIDCFDGDWCARNRANSSAASLEERHGGKVRFGAGMFVHTFDVLVSPKTWFEEHPEYFSEIDGKRVRERTQLCCTNPDVVALVTEELKKRIAADPDAFVYSVSQNDWDNHCECATCQALAEKEGSQMAPVLQLVNQVAEAIEQDYPDKAIETLAYQWTRKAPKTMRPRPNVIIRLCSIECCFMHPLATCDSEANQAFCRDAEEWAQVANRLWVWDYVTSFHHFYVPYPNLRVRDDNIRFFIEHNVTGIFEQDNYMSPNGEFSELSGYLNAKLLWNPDYGEDRAINEFLEGVYGKAAKPIREYIDLLHDKVEDDNIHCDIWIGPWEAPFLTDEVMAKGEILWNRAETVVADDPEVLERVKLARLCHDYSWLELNRYKGDVLYAFDHAHFTMEPKPEFERRVQSFFEMARKGGVVRMDEATTTLDDYARTYEIPLKGGPQVFEPCEPVAVANPRPGIAFKAYAGVWKALPDTTKLTPAAEGIATHVHDDAWPQDSNYALLFSGYFEAPEDGVYTFTIGSNDGSRLTLSDQVLDNDGLHSLREKFMHVALRKGYHPLRVEYFQEGGSKALYLRYDGPGISNRLIPPEAYFHDAP
ncbi:MAG: DUF4838 domain-containing protein [Candidatus Hydrogenedentales bacterium]|jgi:hypothetical protein